MLNDDDASEPRRISIVYRAAEKLGEVAAMALSC
jgi:hypothetical protein